MDIRSSFTVKNTNLYMYTWRGMVGKPSLIGMEPNLF